MAEKIRIVHYINQFFAGIGGEEKGASPLESCAGPKGPGVGIAGMGAKSPITGRKTHEPRGGGPPAGGAGPAGA